MSVTDIIKGPTPRACWADFHAAQTHHGTPSKEFLWVWTHFLGRWDFASFYSVFLLFLFQFPTLSVACRAWLLKTNFFSVQVIRDEMPEMNSNQGKIKTPLPKVVCVSMLGGPLPHKLRMGPESLRIHRSHWLSCLLRELQRQVTSSGTRNPFLGST